MNHKPGSLEESAQRVMLGILNEDANTALRQAIEQYSKTSDGRWGSADEFPETVPTVDDVLQELASNSAFFANAYGSAYAKKLKNIAKQKEAEGDESAADELRNDAMYGYDQFN